MKILFVSPSYKPAYIYGGPAVSVSELAEALVEQGHLVTVYTTTANGGEELPVEVGKPVLVNGVTVYYFKRQTGDHTHISFGLWTKLSATVSSFDTINIQSWWSILVIGAAAICRMKAIRYIISPRGMLSSYTFDNMHSRPKRWVHKGVGLRLLRGSNLHATTLLEWNDCLKVNPAWTGFILPNLVRFPVLPPAARSREQKKLVFGFLSRIDPKKGLELLMQALALQTFTYCLKIAGGGEEAYCNELKALAARLNIAANIEWCGWKSGDEKFTFLAGVDVFMLTSYNENFANTVIESLSVGTPVFLTTGVGLAGYVASEDLGWICEPSVSSISETLGQIASQKEKIDRIRSIAPQKIRAAFDKKVLAGKYAEAYGQIV